MTDLPIRTFELPAAKLVEWRDHVHTFLCDGSQNTFYPPLADDAYIKAAEEMGFPGTMEGCMRYAVQHEIAHHLVAESISASTLRAHRQMNSRPGVISGSVLTADASGAAYVSRIIYNACHNVEQSMEQPESKDEEHLVNRLQRFAMLGAPDPFGQLERAFGAHLPMLAGKLIAVSMPWLPV